MVGKMRGSTSHLQDSDSDSFESRLSIDDCRARLAHNLVLRIRASRNAHSPDNRSILDQGDTAARCNHSVKCEQVVEMHKVDTVLEYFGWSSKSRGSSRF